MNTYRIDLLKDSERRHEGLVSPRFLVKTGVFLVFGILLLALAYLVVTESMLRGDRTNLEATLQTLEPRHRAVREWQRTHEALQAYADEIDGWRQSVGDAPRLLLHLQREMPGSAQLLRLEYRDEIEAPARAARSDDDPPPPARRTRLVLSGRVLDAAGEDVVSDLIARLQAPGDPDAPAFRSVTLVSLQRDRRATGAEVSAFDLDASGFPREIR